MDQCAEYLCDILWLDPVQGAGSFLLTQRFSDI